MAVAPASQPWFGMGQFRKVRLCDLTTDGRFNRPISQHWVEQIAAAFQAAAFGVITCWELPDGTLVVINGQHRCLAARRVGVPEDVKCIPAIVHTGLTLDQAAMLFVELSANRLISPFDRFRALLTAEHTETLALDAVVRAAGMLVTRSAGDQCVSAVTTARDVFRMGSPSGAVLARTLATLQAAWGGAREALHTQLLKGVALYLHDHRTVTPTQLAEAFVKGPGAPINLIGWAKVLTGPQKMRLDQAIARTIETKVLPPPKPPRKR